VISDAPPTLQPVRINPYTRVAIDTLTHRAQTTNIAHPQCATTQPTISTLAADAHTTTTRPNPKITIDVGRKVCGGAVLLSVGGEVGPHLTQYG